jgi:hypothetical protein
MSLLRRPATLTAVLVFALAGTALTVMHHSTRQPLRASTAIHDALRSQVVVRALAGTHWTSASASPLDGSLERVSFSSGGRVVADVAVRGDGTADQIETFGRGAPIGNWVAYEPGVLIALSLLFVLMAAVRPIWRLRNLDLLATLSLVGTVILLQHGFLSASVLVVLPGLGYLLWRCVRSALGGGGGASSPSTALFDELTARWSAAQRVRLLRMVLVTLGLVLVMVGVGSPSALDVAYAAMEGATAIVHGLLPYGHMPGDVIHGDTYPILSYALYVPIAWIAPVQSTWDSIYGALAVASVAALATAAALLRAASGPRTRSVPRAPADEERGLRAAITWLSFPPLVIAVSSGTTDVVLAAMLTFAVVLWRRPAASMAVLAIAGWFKLAPFALVPVWLAPHRGRPLRRALAVLFAVSAGTMALVVALGGLDGPSAMAHAIAYQFDRGSLQSPWVALDLTGLQPIGQAAVLALVAGIVVRLRRAPELAAEPDRIAALAAAVLIALQLAANYWTFLYLSWVMPLVVLALLVEFAPTRSALPMLVRTESPSSALPELEVVPSR